MFARPVIGNLLILLLLCACGSEVPDRDEILTEREQIRAEYGALFDEVSAILFALDPVGINFQTNTDEYEPEVGTILPRLRTCSSAAEARRVIHEEFVYWFDSVTAGPESKYEVAAQQIWVAWQRHERQ